MSNDNNNYQINDFLRNMSKKEIKGIAEIVQGQTSVSLLVQSASFSHSTVAGINIKPYISAVCSIMGNKRTCFASLGTNNPIAIGEEISNKDFVRVIVDSKGKANKKIYLHFKEKPQNTVMRMRKMITVYWYMWKQKITLIFAYMKDFYRIRSLNYMLKMRKESWQYEQ